MTESGFLIALFGGTFLTGIFAGWLSSYVGITIAALVIGAFLLLPAWFMAMGMPFKHFLTYASPGAACFLGYLIGNRVLG